MTDQDLARFNCPTCRASYKWKAEAIGKKVQCKCGAMLRVPAKAGAFAEPADRPTAAVQAAKPVAKPPKPASRPVATTGPVQPADETYDVDLPAPSETRAPLAGPAGRAAAPASGVFALDRFVVRRKFFKLFGAAFHIYGPDGKLAFYSKQKAFKLKEDIRLYQDESMQRELLLIQARQVVDWSASYDVIDPASGRKVGAMRRKGLKSIIKDEWVILDTQDRQIGLVKEDNALLALVRRFVDYVSLLIPQKYHAEVGGTMVATFKQNFNPFVQKIMIDFSIDDQGLLDRRLGIAAAVLLVAIEGRQS
jgi:uncharacterized protein YxjI